MDEFLRELANRKYRYYHFLYKRKPQAYTDNECYERIKDSAKYLEVLDIINSLPPKEKMKVEARFEELKECF